MRREVVGAVNEVVFAMLEEYCPSSKDCAPDEWFHEEQRAWDLISEAGYRLEKRLEEVLDGREPEKVVVLTEEQKEKRRRAADALKGVWAGLPKSAVRELMRKTY
jgi:hypothetical protein